MTVERSPCCPVCGARFRESAECTRCGADLRPVMALMLEAFALRRQARRALRNGQLHDARSLVSAAQERCASDAGRRLLLLARWLAS